MSFPAATKHGDFKEVFPNIHFVIGSVKMPGPVPMVFSRNMVVIAKDGVLTLVNSLRLDEAGLARLEALGKVENVIRVAGFHGMDDPFYKDRYGAKTWAVKGHVWAKGFSNTKVDPKDSYFTADEYVDEASELPLEDGKMIVFEALAAEGILLLEREGGILITGDSLQNWGSTNEFFNLPAKLLMKMMGFIKPHNVGPGWIKEAKPNPAEVKAILDLTFEHVLPCHGDPVVGGAKEKYRPAIERI